MKAKPIRQFVLVPGKKEIKEQIEIAELQKALANTMIWKTTKTN